MPDGQFYSQIQERYGFELPEEYRRMQAKGLLTLLRRGYYAEFVQPGTYLWLNNMEWYSLSEIADFNFASYHLPGFVPFAFTGGGDSWCWQPAFTDHRGTRVLCCFRDSNDALVYAPNFQSTLYRQALEFCRAPAENDTALATTRAFLRRWALDLAETFPPAWCQRLNHLSDKPAITEPGPLRGKPPRHMLLTQAEINEILTSDIAYPLIDTKVQWMK